MGSLTNNERLQLAILDYLIRRGYYETAKLYTETVKWLEKFSDEIVFN